MKNKELADLFFKIADLLEIKKVQWKPQAYRKAARSILNLKKDISKTKIEEIPGVGEGLAKKIKEYLKTGKIKAYEKLKKESKFKFSELMDIGTLGPRKAGILCEKLKIKNMQDLKKAIKQNKIAKLPGFGKKSQDNLLLALQSKKSKRYPLKQILPLAKKIKSKLKKSKEVIRIEIAGSIRRKRPTVRDIDILVSSSNPKKIIEIYTKLPEVKRVLAKGPTRAAVKLKQGIQSDIRVVKDSSFGSALQYFTGSKDHSIRLRQIAIKKGLKLSEYGVFDRKTNKKLAGKTEEGVYKALGVKYPEPKKREK